MLNIVMAIPDTKEKVAIASERFKDVKSRYDIIKLNPIICRDNSLMNFPPPRKRKMATIKGRRTPPSIHLF